MSISEQQFAAMLKGTIHEGKYGTEVEQPRPIVQPKRPGQSTLQPTKPVHTESEKLAGSINNALPLYVGMRVVFSQVGFGLILLAAIPALAVMGFVVKHLQLMVGKFLFLMQSGMDAVSPETKLAATLALFVATLIVTIMYFVADHKE